MKKIAAIAAAGALALALAGCSGTEAQDAQEQPQAAPAEQSAAPQQEAPAKEEPKAEALNLDGTWKSIDNESDDAWQEAVIEGDAITINWVSDGGDTKSLYWAGTVDPTDGKTVEDVFAWDSANDTDQTSKALLASGDETKAFTYEDGQISYEASAMGTTKTVRLERVS
ncbi:hypothetical protein VJ923_05965 [Adlercreutzia sp. R25]|uniref:Lipoprotein n=1 Tax=Adlercreutzia shanghongiae TaxID=3111773 RepID=A0ABU6IX23_9ACTN|nr:MULTISPECIES: hypothetical protein [unclassified Adlercreutzia]MEC4272699.1 hypothetical protein [Adlercreutzia sp. R25]MEC4294401.1 hypothetical protein [Adlercreutzia sp. R22]